MKYVRFEDNTFIVWNYEEVTHLRMAAVRHIPAVSAGFVVDGKCVGESYSLNLCSRPEDTDLLKEVLR